MSLFTTIKPDQRQGYRVHSSDEAEDDDEPEDPIDHQSSWLCEVPGEPEYDFRGDEWYQVKFRISSTKNAIFRWCNRCSYKRCNC